LDPKEPRVLEDKRGPVESLEPLDLWACMETEVPPVFPDPRVMLDQLDVVVTQDLLVSLVNVVLKVPRVPLVWLACLLRRENAEILDHVENKDLRERKDPAVFLASQEHKDSKATKDLQAALEPREETVSQDLKEALEPPVVPEIRVHRAQLDLPVSLDKRVTVVTRDQLDPLDSPVLLEDPDLLDLLAHLVFLVLRDPKAKRVSREPPEIRVSQDVSETLVSMEPLARMDPKEREDLMDQLDLLDPRDPLDPQETEENKGWLDLVVNLD
jgi:hypothetical protein